MNRLEMAHRLHRYGPSPRFLMLRASCIRDDSLFARRLLHRADYHPNPAKAAKPARMGNCEEGGGGDKIVA